MTAFLSYLRVFVSVFPLIVELVRAVEESFNQAGIGASKLEVLKGIISDAYEALSDAERAMVALPALLKAAESIAGRVVAVFNAVGIFKQREGAEA